MKDKPSRRTFLQTGLGIPAARFFIPPLTLAAPCRQTGGPSIERKIAEFKPEYIITEMKKNVVLAWGVPNTPLAEYVPGENRSMEHVIEYLLTELGTTASVDATKRLIIRGRFQQKQIENILRRYINEYVLCNSCRSLETEMFKENRMQFVRCKSCESTKAVSAIQAGFKAQTEKRSVLRQAAA